MHVEDGTGASFRDVADDGLEIAQVGRVQSTGDAGWRDTLHEHGDTEDVHAHVDEDLDGRGVGPDVVGAESTWEDCLSKFCSRLADSEPVYGAVCSSGDGVS